MSTRGSSTPWAACCAQGDVRTSAALKSCSTRIASCDSQLLTVLHCAFDDTPATQVTVHVTGCALYHQTKTKRWLQTAPTDHAELHLKLYEADIHEELCSTTVMSYICREDVLHTVRYATHDVHVSQLAAAAASALYVEAH
eukprot:8894-Heterococcus_DN1.PRE.5